MSFNPQVILSVDDDDQNQALVKSALQKHFNLDQASSGEKVLTYLDSKKPDLILLDVNLPEQSGFEVCEKIRERWTHTTLPILFISGEGSLTQKIQGYLVGGNDYLCKPVFMPELISKINFHLQNKGKYQLIEDELTDTREALFSAISYSGELGSILKFFESSFNSNNLEVLAQATFDTCREFGLQVAVQFRRDKEHLTYSSTKTQNNFDHDILSLALTTERIVSTGNKALFNSPTASILVKNMPVDNTDLYGRIGDHIAFVLKGCEIQLELINTRNGEIEARNKLIQNVTNKITSGLTSLHTEHHNNINLMHASFEDFRIDFEETATTAEINESQTLSLMESLDRMVDDLKASQDQQNNVGETINSIIQSLQNMKE